MPRRQIAPALKVKFDYAFNTIWELPNGNSPNLKTTRGMVVFAAKANFAKDGRKFIDLPHNNRIYKQDWNYRSNHMGNEDGQWVGQYAVPLSDWLYKQSPKQKKIRRIVQKNDPHCEISCVAMLVKKSYAQVDKRAVCLNAFEKNDTLMDYKSGMKKLLKEYGITLSKEIKSKDWSGLPRLAVTVINHNKGRNDWHFAIYKRTDKDSYVIDPHKNIKSSHRTDFKKLKLHAYHEIKF